MESKYNILIKLNILCICVCESYRELWKCCGERRFCTTEPETTRCSFLKKNQFLCPRQVDCFLLLFFYINTSSVAPSVLECLDCFQRGPTYNCVAVLYDAVCNYQPQTWKLKKLKIIVIFTSYWGFLNWAKTLMLWSHVAFNVFLMLQINFM